MTVLLLHRLRFEQTLGAVKLYVRKTENLLGGAQNCVC